MACTTAAWSELVVVESSDRDMTTTGTGTVAVGPGLGTRVGL
jgi:hypothetical protein